MATPSRSELEREIRRLKRELDDERETEGVPLRVIIRQDRVDEDGEVVEENERIITL